MPSREGLQMAAPRQASAAAHPHRGFLNGIMLAHFSRVADTVVVYRVYMSLHVDSDLHERKLSSMTEVGTCMYAVALDFFRYHNGAQTQLTYMLG